MDSYLYLIIFIIILLVLYARYTIKYSNNLIDVGLWAAQSYCFFDDEDAKKAYITVCSSMSHAHRLTLIEYVNHIWASAPLGHSFNKEDVERKICEIVIDAQICESGVKASTKHKLELSKISIPWYSAVRKSKPEFAKSIYVKHLQKHNLVQK